MWILPALSVALAPSALAQSSLPSASELDAGTSVIQNANFGGAVASSGDWVAVGADQSVAGLEGEVQLFVRVGGIVFQREATYLGEAQGDAFGTAVDVDASSGAATVLVGASENDAQGPGAGRAYVLDHVGGQLQLYANLEPGDPQLNSGFGSTVATDADVFAVGRPGFASGAVYLFDRSGGSLASLPAVLGFDGGNGDELGRALALDGGRLAAGAPLQDGAGNDAGAVYLFEQTTPGAPFQAVFPLGNAKVTASDAAAGDQFGASVALEGELLVVGAPLNGDGAAYVFRRQAGGNFLEEAVLTVPAAGANARVGSSVAIDNGRVLVGAERAVTANGTTGAAYVFEDASPGAGSWSAKWSLEAAGAEANAFVGAAIALMGDFPLVGAPRADAVSPVDGQNKVDAGQIHAFDLSQGFCSLDQLGKPAGGRADRFGSAIDIDGVTAVVGSPGDDDVASDAGSVEVLKRSGEAWIHEALLLDPSGSVQGRFGAALDLDGNRLAVGSPSTPLSPFARGRASIWERPDDQTPFAHVADVEGLEQQPQDGFGTAVATFGSDVLVGSPGIDAGRGRVEVHRESAPGSWTRLQSIESIDVASAKPDFGAAVAVDGDRAIVGAPGADLAGLDAGTVTLLEHRALVPRSVAVLDGQQPALVGELAELDYFGFNAIERIGDVDGNGVLDLAVGAEDDEDGVNAGAVHMLRLDAAGSILFSTKIPSPGGPLAALVDPDDRFGSGLGWGEFDGDPEYELAVGARLADGGATKSGAVWIVDLDGTGAPTGAWKIDKAQIADLEPYDGFGGSITNVGDLDGNGIHDLAVGATGDDVGGAVRTILLGPGQTVVGVQRYSPADSGLTVAATDEFGHAVDMVGDQDGDGEPDLAVSAQRALSIGEETGAVYLLDLAPSGSMTLISKLGEGLGGFNDELDPSIRWGAGVASPGDADGDGVDDLLVGAPLQEVSSAVGSSTGVAWVLYMNGDGTVREHERLDGLEGNLGTTIGPFDDFGASVHWLGDHDGDGVDELAIGGSGGITNEGAVWILEVGPGWATTQQLLEASGTAAGDRFGSAVAIDDSTVVVGAPGADAAGAEAGAVVVLEEQAGVFVERQVLVAADALPGAGFGSSVSLRGDRLIVGAPGGIDGAPGVGRSYLFQRTGVGFDFLAIDSLDPVDDGEPGDRYGADVALDGSLVLVGAPDWDLDHVDQGTVYTFSLSSASCPQLLASTAVTAVTQGGTWQLYLESGDAFGASPHFYLVLASFVSSPAIPLAPGVTLPLAVDAVLLASLSGTNLPPFLNTFGTLDASGEAQAQIVLPDTLPASAIGQTLYAAYLLLDPLQSFTPVFASEAVGLELVP